MPTLSIPAITNRKHARAAARTLQRLADTDTYQPILTAVEAGDADPLAALFDDDSREALQTVVDHLASPGRPTPTVVAAMAALTRSPHVDLDTAVDGHVVTITLTAAPVRPVRQGAARPNIVAVHLNTTDGTLETDSPFRWAPEPAVLWGISSNTSTFATSLRQLTSQWTSRLFFPDTVPVLPQAAGTLDDLTEDVARHHFGADHDSAGLYDVIHTVEPTPAAMTPADHDQYGFSLPNGETTLRAVRHDLATTFDIDATPLLIGDWALTITAGGKVGIHRNEHNADHTQAFFGVRMSTPMFWTPEDADEPVATLIAHDGRRQLDMVRVRACALSRTDNTTYVYTGAHFVRSEAGSITAARLEMEALRRNLNPVYGRGQYGWFAHPDTCEGGSLDLTDPRSLIADR